MVAIPPKPPTKTSHTTRTTGQGCRTRPTPPHHLRHRQQPHPLKHPQHRPRRPRNTTRRRNRAQTVVHYTPNTPCHPHFTEVDCTLSKHTGGFATIDPRHAGDTPQSSAYGSNSPQATNENKPHHHDKQTKTCRTRPTQPPKGPTYAQTGHHSPINPTTTPHRDSSADSGLDHPRSTH